jgi:hypothetical protein
VVDRSSRRTDCRSWTVSPLYAAASADLSHSPPESLVDLTAIKLPNGTVLTRAQLEAARDGTWLPKIPMDGDGPVGDEEP